MLHHSYFEPGIFEEKDDLLQHDLKKGRIHPILQIVLVQKG